MTDTCGTCEHWSPQRYGPANGLCKRDTTPAAATPASLEACPSYLPLGSAKGPPMTDDRRCGTCRWCGEDRSGDRVCRRHAPQVTGRNQVRYTEWPCVSTTRDWCGEWAATPEAWGDFLATLPAKVTEDNADDVAARIVAFHAGRATQPAEAAPTLCAICGEPVGVIVSSGHPRAADDKVYHFRCYAGQWAVEMPQPGVTVTNDTQPTEP